MTSYYWISPLCAAQCSPKREESCKLKSGGRNSLIYAPASGSSHQHFVSPLTTFSQTHCSILAWSGSLPWAQMVPRGGNLATVLDWAGSHSCNVQHSGFRRNQLPDNMESEDLEAIWFHILRDCCIVIAARHVCVWPTPPPSSTSTETPLHP